MDSIMDEVRDDVVRKTMGLHYKGLAGAPDRLFTNLTGPHGAVPATGRVPVEHDMDRDGTDVHAMDHDDTPLMTSGMATPATAVSIGVDAQLLDPSRSFLQTRNSSRAAVGVIIQWRAWPPEFEPIRLAW